LNNKPNYEKPLVEDNVWAEIPEVENDPSIDNFLNEIRGHKLVQANPLANPLAQQNQIME
jgi:hypothetical protein